MRRGSKGPWNLILENKIELSPSCCLLVFERPRGFPDAEPGQFVSIRTSNSYIPLLRRPYSIMDLTDSSLTLLVKVVGRGSSILASLERGERIDAIGPLGKTSFPEPSTGSVLFVAGGTGIAPIVFAARRWRRKGISFHATLAYGVSSSSEIPEMLIKKDFSDCIFSTMDGSCGYRGDVVSLCSSLASKGRLPSGFLYSCGPRGMVKALEERIAGNFEEHYTSLETVMACGVGACRGCVIPVREGKSGMVYRTICGDGTVFRASDIAWGEWDW